MRERDPKGDAWYDKHSRAPLTPEDSAEMALFTEFLRRKALGPQGEIRTLGDLYDDVYTNADRMEDVENGRPVGDGRSSYIDGD